jgi:hypothetical protein
VASAYDAGVLGGGCASSAEVGQLRAQVLAFASEQERLRAQLRSLSAAAGPVNAATSPHLCEAAAAESASRSQQEASGA